MVNTMWRKQARERERKEGKKLTKNNFYKFEIV